MSITRELIQQYYKILNDTESVTISCPDRTEKRITEICYNKPMILIAKYSQSKEEFSLTDYCIHAIFYRKPRNIKCAETYIKTIRKEIKEMTTFEKDLEELVVKNGFNLNMDEFQRSTGNIYIFETGDIFCEATEEKDIEKILKL